MSHPVDPLEIVAQRFRAAAAQAFGAEHAEVDPLVRRSDRADAQANLAMGLGKRLGQAPRAVAEALVAAFDHGDLVAQLDVAGPGFINVTLQDAWLADAITRALADERLGVARAGAPETVVVDYSSPNVAKEMHVGHLRSTVIGDSLARVLEWRGHRVIRQNHVGDWGTPFGMLIEHLVDVGEERAAGEVGVGELGAFYQAARGKFEGDAAFADRSRRRVVLLQNGDAATLAHWRVLVDLSARYFGTVYERLQVALRREDLCGESFYNPRLLPLAEELERSGKAQRDAGALCLFPAGFRNKEGQPLPLIVQKQDGGFGYAATDLAGIRYRVNELGATRVLYVVGAPQAQHLGMVFEAARELGWLVPPARAEHVAFGSVLGTDKRMFKSRTGETVRLVDLIDEALERAGAIVAEKRADLDAAERERVAQAVGIGAIKYADLSSDRVKDYVFDLDRMLAFEGNTAPYLQYAHARLCSIVRRAEAAGSAARVGPAPLEPAERALCLALTGFGAAVAQVEGALEPHKLCGYLYDLATAASTFVERCPVLKSDEPLRSSRIALCRVTARTLSVGLGLLGIAAPERM